MAIGEAARHDVALRLHREREKPVIRHQRASTLLSALLAVVLIPPGSAAAAAPNAAPIAVDDPGPACNGGPEGPFGGSFPILEDAAELGWAATGVCSLGHNDSDPDGDPLVQFALWTEPDYGSITFYDDGFWLYTPHPDVSTPAGTWLSDSFLYRVSDGSAWSAPARMRIWLAPVNDPPSFTAGAAIISLPAASGPYSAQWATQIEPGPAYEDHQSVGFEVTTDSPDAFAAAPAVSPSGVLTFTPGPDPWLANVTVTARDDGGLEDYLGVSESPDDTSEPVTLQIAIGPATYTLSGTVGLGGSGAAAGANVHAFVADTGAWAGWDATDGSGSYSLDLAPGSYKLYVQPNAAGYADGWHGGASLASASTVTLTTDLDRDITISPSWVVSGSLTLAGGAAAAGANVHAFDASTGAWAGWDTADGSGAYALSVPQGSYKLYLQPNAAGYDDRWYGGVAFTTATVVGLTANQALDINIKPTWTLSGTLTLDEFGPAPEAFVHAFDSTTGAWMGWDTTDGGNYSLSLPQGSYKLYLMPDQLGYGHGWYGGDSFEFATPVALTADRDLDITVPQTHGLYGTVTLEAGGPAVGANVHVFDATTGAWAGWDETDENGNYWFGLPEATYKLYVQPNAPGYDDGWHGGATFATATGVELTSIQEVDIVVPFGGP